VYILEKDNRRADAFSRRTDIAGTKRIIKSTILIEYEDRSLGPAKYVNNLMISIGLDVPKELQTEIIRQHHDDPVYSHSGVSRIMELIQRNY
jgi:hypothetical protein